MARRKGAAPRARDAVALHVATKLPTDNGAMCTHVDASWTIIKADTVHFPTPFPSASVMDGCVQTLQGALTSREDGAAGAQAAVEAAAKDVRHNYGLLAGYVGSVARTMPPAQGAALIEAVLMYVSAVGKRAPTKAPLSVREGPTLGVVLFIAAAIPGAVQYTYEVSADNLTWTMGVQAAQTRASLAGLTVGKLYYFRMVAFLRDGTTTNPTPTVSFTVR
jgi:hypothetical protein